jgi:hypothetical protein
MEILSQTEIIEQVGGWPQAVVVAMFIIIFVAASCFFAFTLDLDTLGIICGLVVAFLVLFLTMGLWEPKDTHTGRYEYKVILDETYPATQLYEEYEVVDQEGKIWIIQDKESKD